MKGKYQTVWTDRELVHCKYRLRTCAYDTFFLLVPLSVFAIEEGSEGKRLQHITIKVSNYINHTICS